MLKILSAYIKIAHVLLVAYICVLTCDETPHVPLNLLLLEIGMTVMGILITKRHFLDISQIILSLTLTYSLIPNNYTFLTGLFFFKIIYVYNALGQAIDDLFSSFTNSVARLLRIILSILRFTLVEYLFLGLVMLGYKLYTYGDKEGEVPADYIILYKLIVTATTIGYGDVTPKTRLQIYYFTYAIPFICGSFVLYFNNVIPIFGELVDFLSGTAEEETPQTIKGFESKMWSGPERQSFKHFTEEVVRRKAEEQEHHRNLGQIWISIAANNYEKQIPLISSILQGDQSKEVKLKVSALVKRHYYPAGWTILQAGDISEDLMMVDEGEVKTPALQGKGFVFNREGFISKTPSRDTIVANNFVALWTISLRDLQELANSSARVQNLLKQNLRE